MSNLTLPVGYHIGHRQEWSFIYYSAKIYNILSVQWTLSIGKNITAMYLLPVDLELVPEQQTGRNPRPR